MQQTDQRRRENVGTCEVKVVVNAAMVRASGVETEACDASATGAKWLSRARPRRAREDGARWTPLLGNRISWSLRQTSTSSLTHGLWIFQVKTTTVSVSSQVCVQGPTLAPVPSAWHLSPPRAACETGVCQRGR